MRGLLTGAVLSLLAGAALAQGAPEAPTRTLTLTGSQQVNVIRVCAMATQNGALTPDVVIDVGGFCFELREKIRNAPPVEPKPVEK